MLDQRLGKGGRKGTSPLGVSHIECHEGFFLSIYAVGEGKREVQWGKGRSYAMRGGGCVMLGPRLEWGLRKEEKQRGNPLPKLH